MNLCILRGASLIRVCSLQKKLLTVPEASDYFSIGEAKIRDMISEDKDGYYSLKNGNKFLIKKTRFCDYLMNSEAI